MSLFGFRNASVLYAEGRHPRLFFGPEDVSGLRRQTRRGAGKVILDALRPPVMEFVDGASETDDLQALRKSLDNRVPPVRPTNAFELAFVGLLDECDEALEVATRMIRASSEDGRVDPMGYDLVADRLTTAERRLAVRSMVKDVSARLKAREDSYYANAAHNLTFGHAFGGLWSLLAIRGDPGAPKLDRQEAEFVQRFEATLHTVVHPDGYPEEDIGYGTAVFGALLHLAEALRRAGIYDAYERCPRIKNFGQAMLHFVQPWGEAVTNTGDHGSTFANREFSLPRIASETDDPAVLWLAGVLDDAYQNFRPTDGDPQGDSVVTVNNGFKVQLTPFALLALDDLDKQPVHPGNAGVPTQFIDRSRGIVALRSGWRKDDTYVTFDGSHRSPACPGHWHDSAGHFSLSALGEMFSIDTGRYNNEQSQHSVVLVGGKSGRSTDGEWVGSRYHGQLIDYAPDGFCDVVAADTSHQSNCCWARRWLGLVKGGDVNYVWVVEDINNNDAWGRYDWQLQTCPENVITTRAKTATIRGWRHGNCLDVHFALPSANEFPEAHRLALSQDVMTTSSHKYVKNPKKRAADYIRPAAMAHGPCYARPRLVARVDGWNGRFMSVLLPRRAGDAKAAVRQLRSVPSSLAVKVSADEIEDVIIFAWEHNILKAGDIDARGQWAAVRRSRASGRVLDWTLGHGTELSVAGQRLV